MTLLHSQTG